MKRKISKCDKSDDYRLYLKLTNSTLEKEDEVMEPKYMYAESTIKPQSIEMCKNTVYLRTDFVEKSRTDMSNKVTYWTYQEARLTTDEFNSYVSWLMSKNAINGINDSAFKDSTQ